VLLLVLWVRSYWWVDSVPRLHLVSALGELYVKQSLQLQLGSRNDSIRIGIIVMSLEGQQIVPVDSRGLTLPYWVLTLAALVLAPIAWFGSRFTLRSLLIATTLLAIVLGLIVAVV